MHRQLHWLDIPQRITYKLCVQTFKCLHNLAPGYLSRHCTSVASLPGRAHLRSATSGQLVVPSTRTMTLGNRVSTYLFPFPGTIWHRNCMIGQFHWHHSKNSLKCFFSGLNNIFSWLFTACAFVMYINLRRQISVNNNNNKTWVGSGFLTKLPFSSGTPLLKLILEVCVFYVFNGHAMDIISILVNDFGHMLPTMLGCGFTSSTQTAQVYLQTI